MSDKVLIRLLSVDETMWTQSATKLQTPEDGQILKSSIPERQVLFLCSHPTSLSVTATSECYPSSSVSELLLSFNICTFN
jgi:hypothetical protein